MTQVDPVILNPRSFTELWKKKSSDQQCPPYEMSQSENEASAEESGAK